MTDTLRLAEALIALPSVTPRDAGCLELIAARTGRSRFPVVHLASRRVTGFVHVKDVIGLPDRLMPIPNEMVRDLDTVHPRQSLAELLLAMRRARRHMVLVSEGGAPLGVVTLNDVLAVLVPKAAAVSAGDSRSAAAFGGRMRGD